HLPTPPVGGATPGGGAAACDGRLPDAPTPLAVAVCGRLASAERAEATSSNVSKSASAPVTCNGRVTDREAATSRNRPPSAVTRRAPPMSTARPLEARNVTPV